jgi:hypothetical protein
MEFAQEQNYKSAYVWQGWTSSPPPPPKKTRVAKEII